MVNLDADEALLILPVKDIVSTELICHYRGVVLADLVENIQKLLARKLLALFVRE